MELVQQSRLTQKFIDAGLERAYLQHRADAVYRQYRVIALAVLVLWGISSFLELSGAGAETSTILFLRFASEQTVLFSVVVSFLPRRMFDRLWHPAMVLNSVSIGWALVAMSGLTHYALTHFLAGVCLLIVGTPTLAPVRFFPATLATLTTLAGYVIVVTYVQPLSGIELASAIYFVVFAQAVAMVTGYTLEIYQRRDFLQARLLDHERARADALLQNVLPAAIAERLKGHERRIAEHFSDATVLFGDIVGFTPLSDRLPPERLVEVLDDIFSQFDDLADRHGLEKIKTIGDAYMVVGGVPLARADHAEAAAVMALEMMQIVERAEPLPGVRLRMRIGIHSGPVVAGVIGKKKFIYDLWGDTVNTASRMESHGVEGMVQVTAATCERLRHQFILTARGPVKVKGKGEMQTWFLDGRKPV